MSAITTKQKDRVDDPAALSAGYKRTDVGVVPEDWDIGALKGNIKIAHGFAFQSQHFVAHGPYKLTTPGHFNEEGGFRDIGEKQKYYDGPVPRGYLFRPGDLIVAMTEQAEGLLGSAALIPEEGGYLHNQRLGKVGWVSDEIDRGFVYYVFNSERYRSKVRETAVGTKVKHTSPRKLLEIEVPLPPVPEQTAIAAALSDVDGLIGAMDKLIAKKRAIKQAAMQQLLTGKTRMPGFEGKWQDCHLSDLGKFSKGRGVKRGDVSDEGVGCIRYGEIYTRYNNFVLKTFSHIPLAVADGALPITKGDLLFAGSGETAEEIGKCVAYMGEDAAYAGGDIVVHTPSGQNSLYLGHLLNHERVAQQKARLGQGDAVVHISATALGRLKLHLPQQNEQRAIATVLSDMDAEIAALERRRDKTKAIKQGMMQALLTGRIRLVKPGAKA